MEQERDTPSLEPSSNEEERNGLETAEQETEEEKVEEKEDKEEEVEAVHGGAASQLSDIRGQRLDSVWGTGMYISKWKTAHRKGYHASQLTENAGMRDFIRKHEVDYSTSVPLPVMCMMEKEVLQTLEPTVADYVSQLGTKHHLTQEVKQRVHDLKSQVCCKTEEDHIPSGERGWRGTLSKLWRKTDTQ